MQKTWPAFRFTKALPVAAAAMLLLSSLIACGMPEPVSERALKAGIVRHAVELPGGAKISYLSGGTPGGRRVIYVHGTPGEADQWVDYLVSPGQGIHAIAIDRPGFGEGRPATTSLKEQAAALAPFLTDMGGDKPVLVGHSLGGPIVAQAAVDFPDSIGGLVIAAGSLDPALEEIHWLQPVGETWPFTALLPSAMTHANRELLALKGELEALKPRLRDIRIPVVIVHGTKDDLVPYANVAYMQAMFASNPRVKVMTLTGVNHFLPWNSMDAIRRATAEALAMAATAEPRP